MSRVGQYSGSVECDALLRGAAFGSPVTAVRGGDDGVCSGGGGSCWMRGHGGGIGFEVEEIQNGGERREPGRERGPVSRTGEQGAELVSLKYHSFSGRSSWGTG